MTVTHSFSVSLSPGPPLDFVFSFSLLGILYYRESAFAESWIVMDRSGCLYAPRSRFHGQALHAQTNCTLPSPFSIPYNGASPCMLTVILPFFYPHILFFGRFFREDCGSNRFVRRYHRDPLSAPHRISDHEHPRPRNGSKLHKRNSRSYRGQHCRFIAVHPRTCDAPNVARMHRHTRRTTRAHL